MIVGCGGEEGCRNGEGWVSGRVKLGVGWKVGCRWESRDGRGVRESVGVGANENPLCGQKR